ncbi:MAG: HAD-IC family P-type ATPase, partial [Spirochaetia bacterium]|nr:HAD-IC family P-type ATPase [Spirochaetia bacterium]
MDWHLKKLEETVSELKSSLSGLTTKDAEQRLAAHGPNELSAKKKDGPLKMFLMQFTDFMIIILIVAAIISGLLGETVDSIVILIIVILNAIVGFIQEYRAEKAMEALKKMATPMVAVFRDNVVVSVPAARLVPGDVVILEAGVVIPADMRLIEAVMLKVEESALTGESVPVDKGTHPLTGADLTVGDRINMAYRGTVVTYGRGKGIVTET